MPRRLPQSIAIFLFVLLCLLVAAPQVAGAQGMPFVESTVTFEDGVDLEYEVLYEMDAPVWGGITGLDVAPDGRVFFTEINGPVRMLDPTTGTVTLLANLLTSSMWCVTCPETSINEAGVHGVRLAPDFATSGDMYIVWAEAYSMCAVPENIAGGLDRGGETNAGCYKLARFTLGANAAGLPTITEEQVLLTWPFSRFPEGVNPYPVGSVDTGHTIRPSAHHGGGIELLPDGSIVVSVGDNTDPDSSSGYGPHDQRPHRWWQNAERTSQNPADRRGKLLRVMPDGSIPPDNPFIGAVGEYRYGEGPVPYDPYIFAMGLRNPYKAAADPLTGTVYSAQVGPDAAVDDPARGHAGVEELNVIARVADCETPAANGACPYQQFNGGYPRCIGPGFPYIEYDYAAAASTGEAFDCSGFDEPVLWYPKTSEDLNLWPQLNGSGSTLIAGTVNRYDGDGPLDATPLHDNLLLFDWSRSWMATVPVGDDGVLDVSPESVAVVARGFQGAVDAEVGPDGAVYVAEFGTFYTYNTNSRIGRIVCGGCGGAQALAAPALPTPASVANAWPLGVVLAVLLVVPVLRRRGGVV